MVGLLLLALGFAVGIEPQQHEARPYGSVLLPGPDSDAVPAGCPTRVGGAVWLGTWLQLSLGGLVLLVGTTAYRERVDGRVDRVETNTSVQLTP